MITHLVDSDLLIDLLKERGEAVDLLRPLIQAGELGTSLIVYAEVYEGVIRADQPEQRLADLTRLLKAVPVDPPGEATALDFARLRSDLRNRGEPVPDHDLWIAATALQHGLTLVTRDHHFDRISDLKRA